MFKSIAYFITRTGRVLFRRPLLWAALILLPILQILFLNCVEKHCSRQLSIAVLNNDRGGGGTELVQRLQNAGVFAEVIEFKDNARVKTMLEQGQVSAILAVPDGFTRSLLSGRSSRMQLILDGSRTTSSLIARGYINWVVRNFSTQAGTLSRRDDLITLVLRYWYAEELAFKWYSLPGIMCWLLAISAAVFAVLFFPLKGKRGIIRVLLCSILPLLILAAVQTGLLLLAAMVVFQLTPQDNLMAVYWVMSVCWIAMAGVIFAAYGIFRSRLKAAVCVLLVLAVCVLFSGMFKPVSDMTGLSKYIAVADPLKWQLAAIKGVLINDIPASEAMAALKPLLIIAAIMLAMAIWLCRKDRQSGHVGNAAPGVP